PSSTVATTPVTTSPHDDTTTPAGDPLVEAIAPGYAEYCAAAAPPSGAVEAIDCTPPNDPQDLAYVQYPDRASMDAAFDQLVLQSATTNDEDCRLDWGGRLTYQVAGANVGEVACPGLEEGPEEVWTNWNTDILGEATDEYWHPGDAYQWWVNNGESTDN
ncbi:hypothetical protein, partial [Mycobacterium sp.]|uniref:hypothetical protein n=1 Tax=Mycobacterium sp. TaxID=1785 RepID=UPI003BB12156